MVSGERVLFPKGPGCWCWVGSMFGFELEWTRVLEEPFEKDGSAGMGD